MAVLVLHYRLGDRESSARFGPCLPGERQEYLLGRDADCALPLAERSVSRRHARLVWDGEGWTIEDLGSRFGSQLNGNALSAPAPLAAGDRLLLGRLELRVGSAGPDPDAPTLAPEDEATVLSLTAATPRPAPAQAAPATHGDTGEERRYRVLLRILDLFAAGHDLDAILAAVIRLAGEAVGAERGFVLLYDAEGGRWRPEAQAAWQAEASAAETPPLDAGAIGQVSQTVLREALESGRSVCLEAVAGDPRFDAAASLHSQQVQSLVCVPLLLAPEQRRLGALYVDRRAAGAGPFAAADRELLETVAAQAARVIETEQLQAARARAEKLALLGTLVGRLAHELKNPLYNVRGTAENILAKLAAGGLAEEDLRARLERVLAGVDKAEGRMNSLLRFARPGGGQREALDLARVLTAAAVDCAPRFQEAGLRLERDYPRGLIVQGDAEALEQVVGNLLVNAAQAMAERRGGCVRLSARPLCRLAAEPDWVELLVEDEGPGIPAEDLERIFADFFTTKAGGSGLGLAICRHLVAEHRGSLSAENRPEGGARFRLGLPLVAPRA